MVAFSLGLWTLIGGFQALLFFVVFTAVLAVPITVSAAITRVACGPRQSPPLR